MAKLISTTAVDPSESRQDWEAAQTVKKKRGRKPKALIGVDQNRAGRSSEKQETREEKSDSESSERGEFAAKTKDPADKSSTVKHRKIST